METGATLTKKERLNSRKAVEALFVKGEASHSRTAFPLRVVFRSVERAAGDDVAVKILVSVPKRYFKHAVDRNRVKRLIREAYRHRKQIVASLMPADRCLHVAFVWMAGQHLSQEEVNVRVEKLLRRIALTIGEQRVLSEDSVKEDVQHEGGA